MGVELAAVDDGGLPRDGLVGEGQVRGQRGRAVEFYGGGRERDGGDGDGEGEGRGGEVGETKRMFRYA